MQCATQKPRPLIVRFMEGHICRVYLSFLALKYMAWHIMPLLSNVYLIRTMFIHTCRHGPMLDARHNFFSDGICPLIECVFVHHRSLNEKHIKPPPIRTTVTAESKYMCALRSPCMPPKSPHGTWQIHACRLHSPFPRPVPHYN